MAVQDRDADAADNFSRLHPFAAIPLDPYYLAGNTAEYESAMAKRGVLVFTHEPFVDAAFYRAYAPLIWGYTASLQEQADVYASYVCSKVAPNTTSFAGSFPNGQRRSFGLIKTTDPNVPALRKFQDYVQQRLESCGIHFDDTAYYPQDGYAGSTQAHNNDYAAEQIATFFQKNITTIIWPGGYETNFSKAAAAINYLPEWLVAGDGTNDSINGGAFQDKRAWAQAWTVSPAPKMSGDGNSAACANAFKEVDPNSSDYSGDTGLFACRIYPIIRQLFTGIQVAGPRLTPASIDQGYHAIPPFASTDPELPACYYHAGDYTCVKDAEASWWDPNGQASTVVNTSLGCYRMTEGGRRYAAGRWPPGNVPPRNPNDPCNVNVGGAGFDDTAGP